MPDQQQEKRLNMTNLEQLGAHLFDAVVNLDPQEFEAIAGTADRLKTEGRLHECPDFATLFGAIERAVVTDPTFPATNYHPTRIADPAEDAGTYLRAVTGRPERRNIQNRGRRHSDAPLRSATG